MKMNKHISMQNVALQNNERCFKIGRYHLFERHLQNHISFLNNLSLEKELEGHGGCVNCLEWNDSADLLASGSDDYQIILWNMSRRNMLTKLQTQHEGNIFSVKFQPYTNDSYIASASADSTIRLQYVNTGEETKCYPCHSKRVKRICVSKQHPFVILSGSEDGTVREFDIREQHTCPNRSHCNNILINLMAHVGPTAEVKCIQLNPVDSNYIAVGCADPYLRLFDRRMLKRTTTNDANTPINRKKTLPMGCVKYFSPGHLSSRHNQSRSSSRREKIYVTTYTSFSPNGRELLQNLGGEHIYIYNCSDSLEHTLPESSLDSNHNKELNGCHRNGINSKNGYARKSYVNGKNRDTKTSIHSSYSHRLQNMKEDKVADLPDAATALKIKGNEAFAKKNYFQAVFWYNEALKIAPDSSLLFANRAAALLKREWNGDTYDALRNCEQALYFDGGHVKAMYRKARCLFQLKWYKQAVKCIENFKETFPDQKDGSSFRSLEKELKKCLEKEANYDDEDDDSDEESNSIPRRRFAYSPYKTEEKRRRYDAIDYRQRLVGACNTNTDIKEANFFGSNGQYIVAGSDCGCMLLWERQTSNLIEAWHADKSILNCVLPHPNACVIATSGIDPVVRLWSPCCKDDKSDKSRIEEVENLARSNQKRMNMDSFENMIFGYQRHEFFLESAGGENENHDQCRTS